MSIAERLAGKRHAARTLAGFVQHLRNWREVWSAYRRLAPLPPLELRGGMTLHHQEGDDTMCLFQEIFLDRWYTRDGFYRPRPADTVLDLGANVGFFALFLAWSAPGIRVHCFEPGGETRARLERNVRSNGLESSVFIHPFAVADRAGPAHLKPAGLVAQRSLFASEFTGGDAEETVECITLAQAVDHASAERIAFLKLDVEGAEIEVVEGADRATWDRIDRVAFEYHDRFRPGCRARVTTALQGHGFTSFREPLRSPLAGMGLVHASRS